MCVCGDTGSLVVCGVKAGSCKMGDWEGVGRAGVFLRVVKEQAGQNDTSAASAVEWDGCWS